MTPAPRRVLAKLSLGLEGGCGCGTPTPRTVFRSPTPAPDEPIVCTAGLEQKPPLQAQLDGYRAAFEQLRAIEQFEGGFRWVFSQRAGLERELTKLAQDEHACCRFFDIHVRAVGDSVVWQTRGGERSAAVLKEFAQLPARLDASASGRDLAAFQLRIGTSGLAFAADEKPTE